MSREGRITKQLGIIGGLGPMATAYFMELVIQMTDAACDQDHLEMIIYNRPHIPDRTKFILGLSEEDPTGQMIETGRKLVEQGVDCIAIPCITAHYFHDQLEEAIGRPILHLIQDTVRHMKAFGVEKAGIMATDGTIESGLFQEELARNGMESVVPSPENQRKVMHLIYENVKAGRKIQMGLFQQVSVELQEQGAQVIVLGCTELSLIKRSYPIGPGYLDAMEVLAGEAIKTCDRPLKPEYQCLITNN